MGPVSVHTSSDHQIMLNLTRFLLLPIALFCVLYVAQAHPIEEIQEIVNLPDDVVAVEVIEEAETPKDVSQRSSRQYGGFSPYGGYHGGYQNYGHGHGYAPGYGHGYNNYYGHNQGYGHNHGGYGGGFGIGFGGGFGGGHYDHHHHGPYGHHHHYRRAFSNDFPGAEMSDFYPQRPYFAFAEDIPPVVNPGFLGPRPTQPEIQIPVSVVTDEQMGYIPPPVNVMNQEKEGIVRVEKPLDENKSEKQAKDEDKEQKEEKECTCKDKKSEKKDTKSN